MNNWRTKIRRNPKPNVQSVGILCKMRWIGKEENQGKTASHLACATWEPVWQPRLRDLDKAAALSHPFPSCSPSGASAGTETPEPVTPEAVTAGGGTAEAGSTEDGGVGFWAV
jgi:hypothetical protein